MHGLTSKIHVFVSSKRIYLNGTSYFHMRLEQELDKHLQDQYTREQL